MNSSVLTWLRSANSASSARTSSSETSMPRLSASCVSSSVPTNPSIVSSLSCASSTGCPVIWACILICWYWLSNTDRNSSREISVPFTSATGSGMSDVSGPSAGCSPSCPGPAACSDCSAAACVPAAPPSSSPPVPHPATTRTTPAAATAIRHVAEPSVRVRTRSPHVVRCVKTPTLHMRVERDLCTRARGAASRADPRCPRPCPDGQNRRIAPSATSCGSVSTTTTEPDVAST